MEKQLENISCQKFFMLNFKFFIDIFSQKLYNVCERRDCMSKIKTLILERIKKMEYDAFTSSDFQDIANYKSISKALESLEDEGKIRRVRRGIYYLPIYNDFLGLEEAPNIEGIAKAIARQYNWIIVPSGNYALNILGLSTQVPNAYTYISNGPYNEYDVHGNIIYFKHTTSRLVSLLPYKVLIVIQALKTLGSENISEDILIKIKAFLDSNDKKSLIANQSKITSWIYDILRKVCE